MKPDSRRPRVVFVDHVARLSGGEIALVRLLSTLEGIIDPHVVLGEDGPLVSRLREIGVPVEVLPLRPGVRDVPRTKVHPLRLAPLLLASTFVDVVRLRRRLRQINPDIVHTNSLKSAVYGGIAGRLAGIPVVWHVRDRIAEDYLPRPAVHLVRALARVVPRAVIANSQTTLSTLKRKHRGFVLYNQVVPDAVSQPTISAQRQSHDLTIGMIGRISPWKGQHVFLDAFASAFRGEPVRARLIGTPLFGEYEYEQSLVERVDELGIAEQVEFRGFREDVWSELQELDILVHCSTIPEPFGQVVLEGMATGLPVIAANAGGPAELIQQNVNGVLTRPGDVAALAHAMRALADDPGLRRRLGDAARVRSKDFSPDMIALRLAVIYSILLLRDGRPDRAQAGR